MLVFKRKKDQDVVIGEGPGATVVKIVDVRGDSVKLGFIAPDDVRVDRFEVRERIEREGKMTGVGA